jgi:hypothetical protein
MTDVKVVILYHKLNRNAVPNTRPVHLQHVRVFPVVIHDAGNRDLSYHLEVYGSKA